MAFELLLVALPPDTRDIDAELGRRVAACPAADRFFFWRPGTKRIGDPTTDAALGLAGTDRAGDVCRAGQFPAGHIVHHLVGPSCGYLGMDTGSCLVGHPPVLDPVRFSRLAADWPVAVGQAVSGWPPDWWVVEVYANV